MLPTPGLCWLYNASQKSPRRPESKTNIVYLAWKIKICWTNLLNMRKELCCVSVVTSLHRLVHTLNHRLPPVEKIFLCWIYKYILAILVKKISPQTCAHTQPQAPSWGVAGVWESSLLFLENPFGMAASTAVWVSNFRKENMRKETISENLW